MRALSLVTLLLGLAAALASPAAHGDPRRSRARRSNAVAYRAMTQRWHDPATNPGPQFTPDGRQLLRLTSINGRGTADLTPRTAEGGFDEAACAEVARVLSDARSERVHPIDRRLIEVMYSLARHFHAGQLRVVSGYRSNAGRSNHALGRAVDLVIPGARDEAVAAFARTQGFVGVGVYPRSGFVHVDVRDHSFFWVDGSSPGRRSSGRRRRHGRRRRSGLQEVHGTLARQMDEAARTRGVQPLGGTEGPTRPPGEQSTAAPANSSATANGAAPAVDEDDDGGE